MTGPWLQSIADEVVQSGSAPGASIAMRLGDGLFRVAAGFADPELRLPTTPDSLFLAGSITKQFVAVAMLIACGRLGVSLDTPVVEFLPALRHAGAAVTIRHLLSHTSGLRSTLDVQLLDGTTELLLPDVIDQLEMEWPHLPPGESFLYSNLGYFLVGSVLERVTDIPLSQFLIDEALGSAGLHASFFDGAMVSRLVRAVGHVRSGAAFRTITSPPAGAVFGSGSLRCTAGDLAKWADELFIQERFGADILREMERLPSLGGGLDSQYGLGAYFCSFHAHREISHDGNSAGFSSQVAAYPDDGLVVAVMTNGAQHVAESIQRRIAARVFDLDLSPVVSAVDGIDGSHFAGTFRHGTQVIEVEFLCGGLRIRTPTGRLADLVPLGEGRFVEALDSSFEYSLGADEANQVLLVRRNGKLLAALERIGTPLSERQ